MRFLSGQQADGMYRIRDWLRAARRALAPGPRAWRGATWGGLITLVLILLLAAYGLFGQAAPGWRLAGTILLLAAFALAGGLLAVIWRFLRGIPLSYVWVLACTLLVLAQLALTALSVPLGILVAGLGVLLTASVLGASLVVLTKGGGSATDGVQRAIALGGLMLGLAGLILGGAWLLDAGSPPVRPPQATAGSTNQPGTLSLPDPSQRGPYPVRTLYYGSGTDRYRSEYGAATDLVTQPVNGSALIEGWSALRTTYWGFGSEALPLNGRVWYPEGKGAFPLVMIVHGQHPMDDFSDTGYAYLGQLLASRGYIVVSVDQNFLNLSPLVDLLVFHSLEEENDLRAWLLLEHLDVWRSWSKEADSIFYQKVDLDRIALIGHSRGGEAVAVAAAFNRLPCYPDDASVRFDYGFGIRSVVAFAPVDGSYQPAQQEVVLENINYLVLHGAHDMDVFTFQGDRQYSRVRFQGDGDWFKTALYIYGANHGQFNTSWGRKDLFEPVMRVFNLAQLMPGEQQRQIAQVTVSAFLDTTLRGASEYRSLFQDLRTGQAWLPDSIYLHQYQDSTTQMLCTYEEDIDLTSTTLDGARVMGENLTIWREQPGQAKWEDLGDQTVYLGWDTEAAPATASYRVQVPAQSLALTGESVLVFALADANEDPTPEIAAEVEDQPHRLAIDLTVEVLDGAGEVARLPLSHVSLLQPQIEGHLGKARFMSPLPASEAILQHFEFPLADFAATNAALDPAGIEQVRFVFDRTAAGVVVLDNVGFRN